jgi:hypothetical protein
MVVLLSTALLAALGLGVVALGDTEAAITANYRAATASLYAADAAAARAVADLGGLADWSDVLAGTVTSTFVDANPAPTLPSGETADLAALTRDWQRRSDRASHWGADNPVWRLFASGPLAAATGVVPAPDPAYLVVWVADDPGDNDGDPLVDSNGVVMLRSQALGPRRATRAVTLTVARPEPTGNVTTSAGPAGLRILTWREVR